jgi:hypothetical protein
LDGYDRFDGLDSCDGLTRFKRDALNANEDLSNSTRREPLGRTIDFNRKDRAKRYHKSSIFNRQYSIPACPG